MLIILLRLSVTLFSILFFFVGLLWHCEESNRLVHDKAQAWYESVSRALAVCRWRLVDVQQCLVVQSQDISCLQVLFQASRGVWVWNWPCDGGSGILLWKEGEIQVDSWKRSYFSLVGFAFRDVSVRHYTYSLAAMCPKYFLFLLTFYHLYLCSMSFLRKPSVAMASSSAPYPLEAHITATKTGKQPCFSTFCTHNYNMGIIGYNCIVVGSECSIFERYEPWAMCVIFSGALGKDFFSLYTSLHYSKIV